MKMHKMHQIITMAPHVIMGSPKTTAHLRIRSCPLQPYVVFYNDRGQKPSGNQTTTYRLLQMNTIPLLHCWPQNCIEQLTTHATYDHSLFINICFKTMYPSTTFAISPKAFMLVSKYISTIPIASFAHFFVLANSKHVNIDIYILFIFYKRSGERKSDQ